MLVRFEIDFVDTMNDYKVIEHDFQIDFQSEFQAIEHAVDWISYYLYKHDSYDLQYCRLTKEDTSIIYPISARKFTLMCIEGNVYERSERMYAKNKTNIQLE